MPAAVAVVAALSLAFQPASSLALPARCSPGHVQHLAPGGGRHQLAYGKLRREAVCNAGYSLRMCTEDGSDAFEAGRRAASTAVAPSAAQHASADGDGHGDSRYFTIRIASKPLGLQLEQNPSGRGTFIAEVLNSSRTSVRAAVAVGDFVVSLTSRDKSTNCEWLQLADVQAVVESSSTPLTLELMRGDKEPWKLHREGSGLSIEEMMEEARGQYGKLIDEEQEDALRAAFAALKEDEQRAAADEAIGGGFESGALRALSRLSFELRSFVQGARTAVEELGARAANKAALDSRLAISTAEYVLRRALLDTGRVISAGRNSLNVLTTAASPSPPKAVSTAAPFAERLTRLRSVRTLGAAEAARLAVANDTAAAANSSDVEDSALVREAGALLREALVSVEAWVTVVTSESSGENFTNADVRGPDWEVLRERAQAFGGELSASLSVALEEVRTDFEAYQLLDQDGQLPTLLEELGDVAVEATGISGNAAPLRSFALQDDPTKQREDLSKRREAALRAKQFKLAATLSSRASKDASDTFVYGVLPSAKALSKVAAREIARRTADALGKSAEDTRSSKKQGVAALLGEIASEIAQEYKADLDKGVRSGPLSEVQEILSGPTKKLRDELTGAAAAAYGLLQPSESVTSLGQAEPSETRADGEAARSSSAQARSDVTVPNASAQHTKAASTPGATASSQQTSIPDSESSRRRSAAFSEAATAGSQSNVFETMREAGASAATPRHPATGTPQVTTSGAAQVVDESRFTQPVSGAGVPADAPAVKRAQVGQVEADVVDDEEESIDVAAVAVEVSEILTDSAAARDDEGVYSKSAAFVHDGSQSQSGAAATSAALTVVADPRRVVTASDHDEVEAFDVQAESEEDDQQLARERTGKILDSSLVLAEVYGGMLLKRLDQVVVADSVRPWELLRVFRLAENEQQLRGVRAQEQLLEEVARLLDRR